MSEPRSWTLMRNVEAVLSWIRKADGYFTDAGAYVVTEPKPVTDAEPIVLFVRWEGKRRPDDPAMRRSGGFLNGFTLELRIAACLDDAQLTLHSIVDDVEQAFDGAAARRLFDSSNTYPQFESMQVIPAADGLPFVGADLLFLSHSKPRT